MPCNYACYSALRTDTVMQLLLTLLVKIIVSLTDGCGHKSIFYQIIRERHHRPVRAQRPHMRFAAASHHKIRSEETRFVPGQHIPRAERSLDPALQLQL